MEKGAPNERSRNSIVTNSVQEIKEMTRDWQERLKIKEETSTKTMEMSLQEALNNELTCYICYSYMVSPIFQCQNGHTLCSCCNFKVNNKCPTCRQILEGHRNRSLENIAAALSLPCKYANYGCIEKIPYFFKPEHEVRCCFRPYKCIHANSDCNFVGSASSLLNHLYEYNGHDELAVPNSGFEIVCILDELEENDKYVPVVHAHNNYFFFRFEKYYVGRIPWVRAYIDYLGDQDEADSFSYEIKVGRQPNEHEFNGVPQSVRKMRHINEENTDIFKITLSEAYSHSLPYKTEGSISKQSTENSMLILNCKILKKNA